MKYLLYSVVLLVLAIPVKAQESLVTPNEYDYGIPNIVEPKWYSQAPVNCSIASEDAYTVAKSRALAVGSVTTTLYNNTKEFKIAADNIETIRVADKYRTYAIACPS